MTNDTIYILKKAEYGQARIAGLPEYDRSAISRELRWNRGLKGYQPRQARNMTLARYRHKIQFRSPVTMP